jgi:hypothetical protein
MPLPVHLAEVMDEHTHPDTYASDKVFLITTNFSKVTCRRCLDIHTHRTEYYSAVNK